jgi:hypothetical protein
MYGDKIELAVANCLPNKRTYGINAKVSFYGHSFLEILSIKNLTFRKVTSFDFALAHLSKLSINLWCFSFVVGSA